MAFGYISSVSQLPRVKRIPGFEIRYGRVRAFKAFPASQLMKSGKVPLKVTLEEAPKIIGIPLERFHEFGITENEIDIKFLNDALKRGIPFTFEWRTFEPRTLNYALVSVAGRLGNEKIVLEPFDLILAVEALSKQGLNARGQIKALVNADFEASGLNFYGEDGYVVRLACALYPNDKSWAEEFIKAFKRITKREKI